MFYLGWMRSSSVLQAPPTCTDEWLKSCIAALSAAGLTQECRLFTRWGLKEGFIFESFCVLTRVLPEICTRERRRGCAAGVCLWLGRGSTLLCALITRWEGKRQPIRVYVRTLKIDCVLYPSGKISIDDDDDLLFFFLLREHFSYDVI